MCEKQPVPVMVTRGTRTPPENDQPLTAIQAAALRLLIEHGPLSPSQLRGLGGSHGALPALRSRGLVLRERLLGRQVRYIASEKGRSYAAEAGE